MVGTLRSRVFFVVLAATAVFASVASAVALASDEGSGNRAPTASSDAASSGGVLESGLPEHLEPDLPRALPEDPGFRCLAIEYSTLRPGPRPPDPCYRTVDGRMTTERVDPVTGQPWQAADEFADLITQILEVSGR